MTQNENIECCKYIPNGYRYVSKLRGKLRKRETLDINV